MGPGVIVLQEEGCLLCPESGNSGLQLSQGRNVAVKVDGLFVFQEIREAHAFPIPKDSARHFTRLWLHLVLFL
jgi:hypothetical protein